MIHENGGPGGCCALVIFQGEASKVPLPAAAERRAIAAYRRDGIEECLYEALEALGWQPEHIATRGGTVRTGYGLPEG
jgi:hypothetical protein